MKNLRYIRYYENKRYDPEMFRGRGLRGWWIRVLNRFRCWIELKVIYHVLRMQLKDAGPLADANAILDIFEEDAKRERVSFKQPRKVSEPYPTSSLDAHLQEVRKVENPREVTARAMDRYAADPRTRKYAVSRDRRVIMEADTETEIQESKFDGEQKESRSSERTSAPHAGEEARRASLKSYPDDTPADAEEGVEFTGFDDDDPVARERLSARETARTLIAIGEAEEHQRSVLSRE